MTDNTEAWVARAKQVLGGGLTRGRSEVIQFGVSLLTSIYGPQSAQLSAYNAALAQIAKTADSTTGCMFNQAHYAFGTIQNTVAEIEAGLIKGLRAQAAGEVLSELVRLGKETLDDNSDSSKNVAAVLIAAAFEDLIRRMGAELAGISGRPKLEEVITALKEKGVLKGGEVGTSQSYLKFRNDSLHADWEKVSKSLVQSCEAFVEGLLIKHFS